MKLKESSLSLPSKPGQYKRIVFIWVAFFCFLISSIYSYEVDFSGIQNPEILELVRSASQLEKLKESPPATLLGLKRRAEGDMTNIVHALHSLAYYGAEARFTINPETSTVLIDINQGPVYPLSVFKIRYFQKDEEITDPLLNCPITLEDLKVELGGPALPETILNAQDLALDLLNKRGFAFASIKKQDIFADQEAKNVIVLLVLETGPLTFFGPLTFKGMERVKENFFYKKLRWKEGELYNPVSIEKTQEALELSGLFRSVNITHAETPSDDLANDQYVPMEITVLEGKQRSIGFGLNYTTTFGAGFTAEWEDRNIFGEGQKLSFKSNIWQKMQQGNLTYLIPDFKRQNQNLIWSLDYLHQRLKAFSENAITVSGTIERKIDEHLRISYGAMYKRLRTERSDFNGTFNLLKAPIQLRWSTIDNLLDPTKGGSLQFKTIPSFQVLHPRFAYCINLFTGTIYQSLTEDKRHIFAAKFTLGTIFGAGRHEIPPPERFFAGSESTLRGYHRGTVCPLRNPESKHAKPIGGRSIMVYTLELRNRIGKDFGLTLFYDIGNVFKDACPNFKEGIRQSIGIGASYYTPVGPLRMDIGFPLNKRPIDKSCEFYFSIGQSF